MDILSRILSYEDQVYQEYSTKRAKLLKHISEIDTTALTKEQMCIFIHDVKSIIEPIKTSISEIDYYFTNIDFKKTESLEHFNQIKSIVESSFLTIIVSRAFLFKLFFCI